MILTVLTDFFEFTGSLKHSHRDGANRLGTSSKELQYSHRIPPRLEMLMDMPSGNSFTS